MIEPLCYTLIPEIELSKDLLKYWTKNTKNGVKMKMILLKFPVIVKVIPAQFLKGAIRENLYSQKLILGPKR